MRAQFEDEASQMKESQARVLDELAKKHRVTLENTLNIAEKDKNRLLAVSKENQHQTHAHVSVTRAAASK